MSEIINKMPNGLDTVFGTSGSYYREGNTENYDCTSNVERCPIILLDEATAFSDAENEYKIQQALSSMIKNKTVIMIAHRLSTITHADQILVMKRRIG